MSHPKNRGDRRRIRKNRIKNRYQKIRWAHCKKCYPALCSCHDRRGHLASLAKTPVPCSCYMCGNPRRYFNSLTLAELKSNDKLKEKE